MQEDRRRDALGEERLSDLVIGEDYGAAAVDGLKDFFELLVEHIRACLIKSVILLLVEYYFYVGADLSGKVGHQCAQTGENPETCGLHHGRKPQVRQE